MTLRAGLGTGTLTGLRPGSRQDTGCVAAWQSFSTAPDTAVSGAVLLGYMTAECRGSSSAIGSFLL